MALSVNGQCCCKGVPLRASEGGRQTRLSLLDSLLTLAGPPIAVLHKEIHHDCMSSVIDGSFAVNVFGAMRV